jgi:4-amino-4-deoxy-L-arabinose transferase-like glycosyltransferase
MLIYIKMLLASFSVLSIIAFFKQEKQGIKTWLFVMFFLFGLGFIFSFYI